MGNNPEFDASSIRRESHMDLSDEAAETMMIEYHKIAQQKEVTNSGQLAKAQLPDSMVYDSNGSKGPGVYCSCGAYKVHQRGKPLVAWSLRHSKRTGHQWKPQT